MRIRRQGRALCAWTLLTVGLAACGSPEELLGSKPCSPGISQTCYCTGTLVGSQVCSAAGDSLGPCMCDWGAAGMGAPVPGPGAAPADPAGTPPMALPESPPAVPVEPVEPAQPVQPGQPAMARPSSGCGMADWPVAGDHQITSSGKTRDYILHVPAGYDSSQPYNLMFIYHGLSVEPSRIANEWSWNGFEHRAGSTTLFVAPRGQPTSGGIGWANSQESIQLTRDLLAEIRGRFCIDEARIFATGSSYGGIMSNRIGCAMGDTFRAIGPIMGNGPAEYAPATCSGQVAAWLTHGSKDLKVSFESGKRSRDHWQGANHCTAMTMPSTPAECVEYTGCDADYPVIWCPTSNGHQDPPFAAEAIWNFFGRF